MSAHSSSFTAEAMGAFGQGLAAGLAQRTKFIHDLRNDTHAMLAGFRSDRRQRAQREGNARGLSVSELKAKVHMLLSRFAVGRREMAFEFQAAHDAFRKRSRPQGGFFQRGQQPKRKS